jgi:YbbR domain-containing protein
VKNKEYYIAAISGLFGIIVWVTVVMSEPRVVQIKAPLSIESIPEGQAIRSQFPSYVVLKVKGTGWHLAAFAWTSTPKFEFPVTMFRGSKRAITVSDAAEQLSSHQGIQVIEMSPESVYVDIDRSTTRKVPIVFDGQVICRDGYGQVGVPSLSPDSVVISGADELVRPITSWPTVKTVYDNAKAPIEADLALASNPSYRLTLNVPEVRVRIAIEPFAEKTFSGLPVDIESVAPNRELILIPPKIDIVVRGGIKQLSGLSNEDFRARVNYHSVIADSSGMVQAEIESPSGVQVVAKKPERMQYVVRKRL